MSAKKKGTTGSASALVPLLATDQPVDWWFAFKFNAAAFQGCGGSRRPATGIFGGTPQAYPAGWSLQYAFASSKNPTLQKGPGCLGTTLKDPVGATFDQVYNGDCYYVLWNDQFYQDPPLCGKSDGCSSPWGHSKGMVAWNEAGEGFVMQVSTPAWPGSGSAKTPRKLGNTLGYVRRDDDIEMSQHFFALRLNKQDLALHLRAIRNASVVTDPTVGQIVRNGGPKQIQNLVNSLGKKSKSKVATSVQLSTGVGLISKPSRLAVPPWQMVSALSGSAPLRVASYWANPEIYSTTATSKIGCWDDALGKPGAVDIAVSGKWEGTTFELEGGAGKMHNHAKVGVSTRKSTPLTIFGDMNQQGALYPGYAHADQKCSSSQNGRGGTFFVLKNRRLWESVTGLLAGKSAPTEAPKVRKTAR